MEEKIKEFEVALLATKREGMDRLLEFIRKSDFYTAPASTRFHSCHESGLLEHSLNVFYALTAKKTTGIWQEKLKDVAMKARNLRPVARSPQNILLYNRLSE